MICPFLVTNHDKIWEQCDRDTLYLRRNVEITDRPWLILRTGAMSGLVVSGIRQMSLSTLNYQMWLWHLNMKCVFCQCKAFVQMESSKKNTMKERASQQPGILCMTALVTSCRSHQLVYVFAESRWKTLRYTLYTWNNRDSTEQRQLSLHRASKYSEILVSVCLTHCLSQIIVC